MKTGRASSKMTQNIAMNSKYQIQSAISMELSDPEPKDDKLNQDLRVKQYCAVLHCNSCSTTNPSLAFFNLPLHCHDPLLRRQWVEKIGRKNVLSNHRLLVCEKHFSTDVVNGTVKREKYLSHKAIPTLNMPNILVKYLRRPRTNKKNALKQAIEEEKLILESKERQSKEVPPESEEPNIIVSNEPENNKLYSLCKTLTNSTLECFIKLHVELKSITEGNGRVYSDKYKETILHLYYGNPQAYRILHRTIGLPPVSTLIDLVPSTTVAVNNNCIDSFKTKIASLSMVQKFGTICLGITRIKPNVYYDYEQDCVTGICGEGSNLIDVLPAKYAVVAMARGITSDWHHIVGFSFHTGRENKKALHTLNTWINKLVKTMFEIGITIQAIITGTESLFINAFSCRYFQRDKPFFFINCSKIYHLFDPAHLMLLLCDELRNNTVHSDKVTAKWENISKFYAQRCASLKPGERKTDDDDQLYQDRLKSALGTLSWRTAAGISTMVDMKEMEKDAMQTADFIAKINRIFAMLQPRAATPGYRSLENESENDMISFITDLKCYDDHKNEVKVNFINCFTFTIKNVCSLKEDLGLSNNASVVTRNFNLDPLIAFVDESRLCAMHKYPTPRELVDIFRDDLLQNNFNQTFENTGTKCDNLDFFVANANGLLLQMHNSNDKMLIDKPLDQRSDIDDYVQLEPKYANSIVYVATYLLDKMCQKYKNSESTRMKTLKSSVHVESKHGEGHNGSIIVPDNEFMTFVSNLDYVFATHCTLAMIKDKMYEDLMDQMNKFISTVPTDETSRNFIIGLFVELRIYHTVNYNNEMFGKAEAAMDDIGQFVVKKLV